MSARTYAEPKKSSVVTPKFDASSPFSTFAPEPVSETADKEGTPIHHNLGDISVLPAAQASPPVTEQAQSFKDSCPLSLSTPTRCPYGGACHTCPPKVQAKLKVGQPNDKYEQEADSVADRVMSMPEPKVQRSCKSCDEEQVQREEDKEEEVETAQTKPISEQITPLVQRQEEDDDELQKQPEKDEELKRQPVEEPEENENTVSPKAQSGQTPKVTPGIESNINSMKGGGSPLPESTRSFMEPRFGHDFSKIRVHTDSRAADTAGSIKAKAFTVENNIAFNAGQYSPDTKTGSRLLAHELTHVVQQKGVITANKLQRQKNKKSNDKKKIVPKKKESKQDKIASLRKERKECYRKCNGISAEISNLLGRKKNIKVEKENTECIAARRYESNLRNLPKGTKDISKYLEMVKEAAESTKNACKR